MSAFRDLTYLEHIEDSIEKIQSYTKGLSEESFQNSTLVQDAVVRQFEIIGEATKDYLCISGKNILTYLGKIWLECEMY